MEMVNYKNKATGLAESFEVGSNGDRKRRADPKRYICLNPEAIKPKPAADSKPPDTSTVGKK